MQSNGQKGAIVNINLTPLVDVSLVLVVIFMATAPMLLRSGIVVAPGEKNNAADSQPGTVSNVMVDLDVQGIKVNGQPVTMENLPARLRELLAAPGNPRVVVSPARNVKHGQVIRVMDVAKQAGAKKLVFMGAAQE